jgi:DNA-binding response OmpR family regulator
MQTHTQNAATNLRRRKHILLIEDEGEMCFLLNLILENNDFSVMHVKSLADANSFLRENQTDLILLDNRLPDGYGLDFIKYIKTNYPAIKIIMISGVDVSAEDFALEMGADLFLAKPFTKATLLHSVDQFFN